jgi:hypothetical protein
MNDVVHQLLEERNKQKIRKWLKKQFGRLSDIFPVSASSLLVVVSAGQVLVSLIMLLFRKTQMMKIE